MKLKVTILFKDSDEPFITTCSALVAQGDQLSIRKGLWYPYVLDEIGSYAVEPCEEES